MPNLKLPHDQIVVDSAVLPRMDEDEKTVKEYADIRRLDPDQMPSPVVFFDQASATHYLADGYKRLTADKRNGLDKTLCEVRKGTRADAVWFASAANLAHGTRMTASQKRQAVENCLQDEHLASFVDSVIADQCGVSTSMVQSRRSAFIKKIEADGKTVPGAEVRRTKSGKTRKVKGVGGKSTGRPKKKPEPVEPEPVEPPEAVDDSLGEPVPEWMADVWADVARINAYLTGLTAAVVTPLERLHGSESGAGYRFDAKYVANQLSEIRRHVRDEMPWCVCPECRTAGKLRKTCEVCEGQGWLTHNGYNGAYLT